MRTAVRESRGAALERFQEHVDEHRFESLREKWSACPVCGGRSLERPTAAHRRLIPEVEGICGTCGAALMRTPDFAGPLTRRRH